MQIHVTKYAVKRYRERLFDYSSSDKTITCIIEDIAKRRKVVGNRLHNRNTCREIRYRGIFIVTVDERDSRIVIPAWEMRLTENG